MKRNKFCMAAILLAVSLFASASANALTEAQTADIKKTIARTPALELTPAAQRIIRVAKSDEKAEVALVVVRAALAKNARVAVALVKAVTKEVPQIAAEVAAIAAQFNPSEAVEIARVASINAPKSADSIAVAVAKVAPSAAAKVTKAVVASAPAIAPAIIKGVIAAVPTAQSEIENDATIRIVSAFARMTETLPPSAQNLAPSTEKPFQPVHIRLTQDSATHGGIHGTISIRPGGIIFTPGDEPLEIDAADAILEARSAQFVTFINTINALELRTDLNDAQRSAVANAIVLVANSVVTDFGVPKSEQNGTFTATSSSLNDLLNSFPQGGDPKKDAAVDLLLGISSIVTDPETPGDQQVSLVNFIAGQIGTTLSQGIANKLTPTDMNKILSFVVKEVTDTVKNSTTPLTQQELGALLINVTTTVQTELNNYANP